MRRVKLGTNVTVFLAFFGIALIQATQEGHWPAVVFWLAVGSLFLAADNVRRVSHKR
jgi:hypothetical protein